MFLFGQFFWIAGVPGFWFSTCQLLGTFRWSSEIDVLYIWKIGHQLYGLVKFYFGVLNRKMCIIGTISCSFIIQVASRSGGILWYKSQHRAVLKGRSLPLGLVCGFTLAHNRCHGREKILSLCSSRTSCVTAAYNEISIKRRVETLRESVCESTVKQ